MPHNLIIQCINYGINAHKHEIIVEMLIIQYVNYGVNDHTYNTARKLWYNCS